MCRRMLIILLKMPEIEILVPMQVDNISPKNPAQLFLCFKIIMRYISECGNGNCDLK